MSATLFFILGIATLLAAAEKGKHERDVVQMYLLTVVGMLLLGAAFALLEAGA